MTGTHSVVIAGDAVECVSGGDGGGCAHNGGIRHPLLQVLNARCGSGLEWQFQGGKCYRANSASNKSAAAPLFEAARSGGQAPCARSDLQRDLSGEVNPRH